MYQNSLIYHQTPQSQSGQIVESPHTEVMFKLAASWRNSKYVNASMLVPYEAKVMKYKRGGN